MKRIKPKVTLLQVVRAVAAEAETDAELVATVIHMIAMRKVELIKPFDCYSIVVEPAPVIS